MLYHPQNSLCVVYTVGVVSCVCAGKKPTISCETLSAIWLVWWRKRTVETSPNAAKHLEKKREIKTKRVQESEPQREKERERRITESNIQRSEVRR